MFRIRKIVLLALMLFTVFLGTTTYLFNILQSSESEVKRSNTVEEDIIKLVKELPDSYLRKPLIEENSSLDIFLKNINYTQLKLQDISLTELWKEANSWVSESCLVDFTNPNLGKVVFAMKHASIIKADTDTRGTQLKLLLTLKGDQQVVFKPKWYPKEKVIEGPVYSGKDRYGSEIVAFYLSVILNKPLTPISTERNISLRFDILPVASKRLLATNFEKKNSTCIYGKCFYCKKQDPICDDENFILTGAVIFNVKRTFSSYRSPWQRTYKKGKKAVWEEFPNKYCKTILTKLSRKRLYDLIDTAIFDFLIQNGDRHHYETFEDTVILLDNGKGLGNPYTHHIDILAPLYQCCMLKRQMHRTLLKLTGGVLTDKLKLMPDIDHFITPEHFNAIEERLLIVFAAIQYCKNQKMKD